eukprot:TRINITY_DN18020_c0_g1_i1.p1 TRINITY_DN18020_c0_g1~~TRINITY_DN18020_c0_g1_i1.p1  ORF type:complete len:545 (-),score=72.10 TRINITY_DN18020_c0_g1_i1:206-1762(-)
MMVALVPLATIAVFLLCGTGGERRAVTISANATAENASLGVGSVLLERYVLTEKLQTRGFFEEVFETFSIPWMCHADSDSEDGSESEDESDREDEKEVAKRVAARKRAEEAEKKKQDRERIRIAAMRAICDPGNKVGFGAYGTVYQARDTEGGNDVVVKCPTSATPETVAGLSQECELLQQLLRGEKKYRGASNIVECLINGANREPPFIVMTNGGDELDTYLFQKASLFGDKRRDFSNYWGRRATRLLEIFTQVLDAVSFMAEQGYWHRDLKPANIVARDDSKGKVVVKMIDFGFAAKQKDLKAFIKASRDRLEGKSPPRGRVKEQHDAILRGQHDAILRVRFAKGKKTADGELKVEEYTPYAPPEVREYALYVDWHNVANDITEYKQGLTLLDGTLASVEAFDLWSVGMSFIDLLCDQGEERLFAFAEVLDKEQLSKEKMYQLLLREACWPQAAFVNAQTSDKILDLLTSTLRPDPKHRRFPGWYQKPRGEQGSERARSRSRSSGRGKSGRRASAK